MGPGDFDRKRTVIPDPFFSGSHAYYVLNDSNLEICLSAFTCSKSTMGISEQWAYLLKVDNKDTQTTSLMSFWCLYW